MRSVVFFGSLGQDRKSARTCVCVCVTEPRPDDANVFPVSPEKPLVFPAGGLELIRFGMEGCTDVPDSPVICFLSFW